MRATGPRYPVASRRVPVFTLDPAGQRYIRTEDHWIPGDQSFVASKPDNGFRVFCLGGSAALGWPHHPRASYPALLETMLRAVLPEVHVEVVNVAGNSYGSHRVRAVFDEIRHYDPDVVLVYSGNNEFVEDVVLGGTPSASGLTSPSAFLRLSLRALGALGPDRPSFDAEHFGPEQLTDNRIAVAFGWPARLRSSAANLPLVVDHYRSNIDAIVRGCRADGTHVLLLTVPVNLREWSPVASNHRTDWTDVDADEWQQAFREGVLALERGEPQAAVAPLQRAVTIDAEHAESWFLLGSARHRLGRVEEARLAFERALRRDAFPVRSMFNHVLEQVARRRGVELVDLVGLLEAHAVDGLIGLDVLVDYVHPTVLSNERIAHRVLVALAAGGLLPSAPAISIESARVPVPERIEEELWTLRGLFGQYLVMRQFDGLESIAARLHAEYESWSPELDEERRSNLQAVLARVDASMEVVRRYRRLLRAQKLGIVDEEFSPDEAEQVFDEYVEMVRTTEARLLTREEFEEKLTELDRD
jgi:tetratricopeptide (TPR) repeat protein